MSMKFTNESEALKTFIDDGKFSPFKNASEEKDVQGKMFSRLEGLYSRKEEAFERNTQVYETYFRNMFDNFEKFNNDLDSYTPLFKNLEIFCASSGKTFSNLKHLSYSLADTLEQAGKILFDMAEAYGSYNQSITEFNKKVGLKSVEDVQLIDSKVQKGLKEWGVQLKGQKNYVIESLANLFHFRKHEYLTVSGLIEANRESEEDFRKAWKELDEKKKTLFAQKNVEKWRLEVSTIKEDFNTVVKDFMAVRKYMLPHETKPLLKQFQLHLFKCRHILFEYINFYLNSAYFTEKSFSELTDRFIKSFQGEDTFWNKFYVNNVDISQIDRESTSLIQSVI